MVIRTNSHFIINASIEDIFVAIIRSVLVLFLEFHGAFLFQGKGLFAFEFTCETFTEWICIDLFLLQYQFLAVESFDGILRLLCIRVWGLVITLI